jgi:gas vesicle protein
MPEPERPRRFRIRLLQETYEVNNIQSKMARVVCGTIPCDRGRNLSVQEEGPSAVRAVWAGRGDSEKLDFAHPVQPQVRRADFFRPRTTLIMEKNTRNRTTRVGIWSALVGGALGFALGMLFAPKRGPDARRRLTYQVEHLAAQAGDTLRNLLRRRLSEGPHRTGDELVADAEARADHIRSDIDALLEELRRQREADSSDEEE